MHEFSYNDNTLCCENVPLPGIIKEHPTPFYLYSHKTLVDHFNKIKTAFKELDPLICFSMKCNSNLNVCRTLVNEGAGLDIV